MELHKLRDKVINMNEVVSPSNVYFYVMTCRKNTKSVWTTEAMVRYKRWNFLLLR